MLVVELRFLNRPCLQRRRAMMAACSRHPLPPDATCHAGAARPPAPLPQIDWFMDAILFFSGGPQCRRKALQVAGWDAASQPAAPRAAA